MAKAFTHLVKEYNIEAIVLADGGKFYYFFKKKH